MMKNTFLSILFTISVAFATSCSTSKDIDSKERVKRDDGTVIKRERHIDENGIEIKKRKRDRDILHKDKDDRDVDIKIRRHKDKDSRTDNDDNPAIIIKKDN